MIVKKATEKLNKDYLGKYVPLFDVISENSTEISSYLVGGSLRNLLLDRPVYDWDFIVENNAGEFAKKIAEKTGSSFVVLDEKYGIYRVVPPGKKTHIDFSNCRGQIEEDLKLRDFTMNAIALKVGSGELIDPTSGIEDLSSGIIRACRRKSLIDDPLRVLRAYRMQAQFGFTIERETKEWIPVLADGLEHVAFERIRDEIFKILSQDLAAAVLREMYNDGVLLKILPELKMTVGLEQNNYHRFDVFDHSLYTLMELENLALKCFVEFGEQSDGICSYLSSEICNGRRYLETVKFAALLHDIGKPDVKRMDKGVLYYVGHQLAGAEKWEKIARRFRLSTKEVTLGSKIIKNHLMPITISQEKNKIAQKKKIYTFFKLAGTAAPGVVLLSWADVEAGRGNALTWEMIDAHHKASRHLIRHYFREDRLAKPPLYLNGHDIISISGLGGGKIIGDIINALEELTAIGEINNRREAEEYVRKNYEKK